jgi:hypothetical protein
MHAVDRCLVCCVSHLRRKHVSVFDGLLLWTRFVKKKDAMTEMAEALGAHRAKEFNLGKNPNRLGGCLHAAE